MSARIPIWSRVAFLVLLPFVAYSVWDYIENRRLESRLNAIVQRHEPLETVRVRPRGDELRADRLYRAASALVTLPARPDRSLRETNQLVSAWRTFTWTADAVKTAREDVDANRDALQFVDRAADLPFVNFLPGTSYNYQSGDLLTLARLVEYRTAVALDERSFEAALASLYSEARLTRAFDASPVALGTVMPKFGGLSAAVAGASGSPLRGRLARVFADLDRDDRLQHVLITGRAMMLDGGMQTPLGPSRRTGNPFVVHIAVQQLDAFASEIAAADAPWPARIEAVNAIGLWPYGFPTKNAAENTVLRNFTKSIAGQVKTIRCARLIASPEPLSLVDPFSDKPLEPSQCHL